MTSEQREPYVAVILTEVQTKATVVALRDRLFETERYISGAGYSPCHPTCEHCAPKVAHFAELQAGLIERKQVIQSVLTLLTPPSDSAGSSSNNDIQEGT